MTRIIVDAKSFEGNQLEWRKSETTKFKYSKVGSRKEKSNVEEEWVRGREQRREVETKSLCCQSLKEAEKNCSNSKTLKMKCCLVPLRCLNYPHP